MSSERAPGAVAPARPAPHGSRLSEEDRQLVADILAGDEEAFVGLMKRHHASLMRQAVAMLRDQAAAEDMIQETWVAVLEGLER